MRYNDSPSKFDGNTGEKIMNKLLKEAVAFYATITPQINAAIMAHDSGRYHRLARISNRAHDRIMRRAAVVIGSL